VAEKLSGHKAWWTLLADGKMVLHMSVSNVCVLSPNP